MGSRVNYKPELELAERGPHRLLGNPICTSILLTCPDSGLAASRFGTGVLRPLLTAR